MKRLNFLLSIYFQKQFTLETSQDLQAQSDPSKKFPKEEHWINAYQLLLQFWEGMFTLVFLALFTMNVQFLCLSYKCTLLWVYHNMLMF